MEAPQDLISELHCTCLVRAYYSRRGDTAGVNQLVSLITSIAQMEKNMSQESVTPNNVTNVDRKSFTSKIEESLTQSRSVLGKNIAFRGELIGNEDLHIEGKVEGIVIMEGHDLSVGKEGEINANVHANNIAIYGKLTGDVLADELIEIKNTAVVKGNLIAPRIQLDDGGKFRGSMDMTDGDQEIRKRHEEFRGKLVHPDLPEITRPLQAKSGADKPAVVDKPIGVATPPKPISTPGGNTGH